MKYVKVKNAYGSFTTDKFATEKEALDNFKKLVKQGIFGKDEYIERIPMGDPTFNEEGNAHVEYREIPHPAEFSYTIEDDTAEVEAVKKKDKEKKDKEDKRTATLLALPTTEEINKITTVKDLKPVVMMLRDLVYEQSQLD